MGLFFAAHADRDTGIGVVKPGFLMDVPTAFDDAHLARNLMIDRQLQEPE